MSVSSRTRSKLIKQREESLLLDLPEEVHDEIFLKLPAKSILVSRCVCKVFYNLLSKPNFIKNHVNRTNQSKNNPKILFTDHTSIVNPPMSYSICIDYALLLPSSPSAEFDGAVLINYPFESGRLYCLDYVGSCNGLICSRIRSIHIDDFEKKLEIMKTKFCIMNPLTREFKEFKQPETCCGNVTYGFGYDSSIDDYKLVMISDYEKGACYKIDVYTVKSDSWSSSIQGTDKFIFRSGKGYHGVFFNGHLYWLASIETSSEVIFSFDISNEIVVTIPLPENIMPPTDCSRVVYKNVGVWGDCIGIACIWGSSKTDVWVMQEYGVKESWIKKYPTTQLLPSSEVPIWRPLWCFGNGEILVETDRKQLYLCNPTTERVRSVVVRDINMATSRESYVESIVSLGSGTYLKKPITDEVMKNSERQQLRGGRHQSTTKRRQLSHCC